MNKVKQKLKDLFLDIDPLLFDIEKVEDGSVKFINSKELTYWLRNLAKLMLKISDKNKYWMWSVSPIELKESLDSKCVYADTKCMVSNFEMDIDLLIKQPKKIIENVSKGWGGGYICCNNALKNKKGEIKYINELFICVCEDQLIHITGLLCLIQQILLKNEIIKEKELIPYEEAVQNMRSKEVSNVVEVENTKTEHSEEEEISQQSMQSNREKLEATFTKIQDGFFDKNITDNGVRFVNEEAVKNWFESIANLIVEVAKEEEWSWQIQDQLNEEVKYITHNILETGARFTSVDIELSNFLTHIPKYKIAINEPLYLESDIKNAWEALLIENNIIPQKDNLTKIKSKIHKAKNAFILAGEKF